jgi:hypothetical protein
MYRDASFKRLESSVFTNWTTQRFPSTSTMTLAAGS